MFLVARRSSIPQYSSNATLYNTMEFTYLIDYIVIAILALFGAEAPVFIHICILIQKIFKDYADRQQTKAI